MATDPETGEWIDDNYQIDEKPFQPNGPEGNWQQDQPSNPVDNGTPYDDSAHNTVKPNPPSDGGSNGGGGGQKTEADMKRSLGGLYTSGAYEEYQHHDFDPGWYDRIVNKENLRANNEPGSDYHDNGKGGYLTPGQKAPQGGSGGGSKLLGGYDASGGSSNGPGGSGKMDDVYGYLKGLFPGGGFNQDTVNRRLDSVRGGLESARKSATANNEAYLDSRGLVGSGPQATANGSLESRLFGQFGSAYNDIYANESDNADKRMIASLQAATGMSEAEAQQQIDWYRAKTENTLGQGNLAARNKEADISKLLGMGQLGVAQGGLGVSQQNANTSQYSAQKTYEIATAQIEQAQRDYDEAVRNHDMVAADNAEQRKNELLQIRAAGTHK